MKSLKFSAILLASAVSMPALAQVGDITSTAGSNSDAVSGSTSGASSDNFNQNGQSQGQQQNNAGIGNSESVAVSGSEANSASVSGSESNGNEQGQSQGLSNSNTLGQTTAQGNQQGVTFTQTYNTTQRHKTINEVRTNAAVPLAASSSFSSDYCGGTASGGASIAPIGVSISGAAPTFDHTCQYIRLAQTGGMMAANWHNMGEFDMRNRMMTFATWATCMAGPEADKRRKNTKDNVVMEACLALGLLGSGNSPISAPAVREVTPAEAAKPNTTQGDYYREKTPRGDLQYESVPVTQSVPAQAAR